MPTLVFASNADPTLGVEIELALVNQRSMALSSSVEELLKKVPERFADSVKPELMQCYLEINTGICRTVGEAERDLSEKLQCLEQIADSLGLRFLWSGTHPFSPWQNQTVTPNERYAGLVELLQDTARQLVTFGLHVHVGVDSGDKAVMICDRIMQHLPTLLAISCNSPFWENRVTGLQSYRSKVMDDLPTAGLPPVMRNWSEYTWLINHLIQTGFINTIREIWWDVRPHHNFGTVEVRVCDLPGNLTDTLAIVALVQCLVKALSDEIDHGTYQLGYHPMMVRQNKWRACRFGLGAELVDSFTYQVQPVPRIVERLVNLLDRVADQLQCRPYLEDLLSLTSGTSWADRQLALLEETGDPVEVVRRLTDQSRLSPKPESAVPTARG